MAVEATVVGVDFGTLGARAVVVRVADGEVVGSAIASYPHGVVDDRLPGAAVVLPPAWALQVPSDYRAALRDAVPAAVRAAGVPSSSVVGLGIDATSCTVIPVAAEATPLCELPAFADRPHAYPKLWKHHAAQPQASRITEIARERGEAWLSRYGGAVSSESAYPKALQILEEDAEIYDATDALVEAGDWIVWLLTGEQTRSAGAAGYKGLHQDGAPPRREFLAAVHPGFADFASEKLWPQLRPLGGRAGGLSAEAAAWTGLTAGIPVAVANIDAHATVPAAGAVAPGQLTLIMGTSTCHLVSTESLHDVAGVSGVTWEGIVPGLWGYEAGQSGVGDIFGWFVEHGVPPAYHDEARRRGVDLHTHLSELAARQPVGAHGLVALDWHNGNRSVLSDHDLSGLVVGQTLATRAEDTYRALLEATAFGTRVIIEAFEAAGVEVGDLVVAGGLVKNPLLMQIYADVAGRSLSTLASGEGSAVGSAIQGAVAAGRYPDLVTAAAAMGRVREGAYAPRPANVAAYDELYRDYRELHDHFGRGGSEVMRRLRQRRRSADPSGDLT